MYNPNKDWRLVEKRKCENGWFDFIFHAKEMIWSDKEGCYMRPISVFQAKSLESAWAMLSKPALQ